MTDIGRKGFAIIGLAAVQVSLGGVALAGPLDGTAPSPGTDPTLVSLQSSTGKAVYGSGVKFSAKLSSFGEKLKGKNVSLYRLTASGAWERVAGAKTRSSGKATFKVKPSGESTYAVAYSPHGDDLGKYSQSESNNIKMSVAPSISVGVGNAARGAIPGQRVRVKGTIKPSGLNPGVKVRVYRNGRKIHVKEVTLKSGRFGYSFKANRTGRYRVKVASTAASGFRAGKSRVRVFRTVYPLLVPGSKGPAVSHLQRSLKKLKYWVGVTGSYDGATARAVLAFRKITGMSRVSDVNATVWKKISRGGGFKLRHKRKGRYVEADLSRQVLVLARDGKVHRILHTSTGALGMSTILGTFSVYMHQAGYNQKRMYYSVYFIRGYAIHGFDPVPIFPASHGCLRIPEENAVAVFNWLRKGDKITVYG